MVQLKFLAVALAGLHLSSAAPLTVTTSSDNWLAGILAGLGGTTTATSTSIASTNTVAATAVAASLDNAVPSISELVYLTPTTTISGLETTAVASETGNLSAILASLEGSSTETGLAENPNSVTDSGTALTGTSSELVNLVFKVVKFLASAFGASSSIINVLDDVANSLDGETTASAAASASITVSAVAAATSTAVSLY